MSRALYTEYLWRRDSSGFLKIADGVTVTVLDVGTTDPVEATLYAAATGSTTLSNPLTSGVTDGKVLFFMERGQQVDLKKVHVGYAINQTDTVNVIDPTVAAPPFFDLPPGCLDGYNTAKQAAINGTGTCTVLGLGISTTQGFNSETDTQANGWFGRIRTALLALGQRVADYIPIASSAGSLGAGVASTWTGVLPWVLNTGAYDGVHNAGTLSTPNGGYERAARWTTYVSGTMATYLDKDAGTAVEVHHFVSVAADDSTFTFTIDNDPGTGAITCYPPSAVADGYTCVRGSAVGSGYSYTVTNPSPSLTGPILKCKVAGLNLAKHTVNFTGQSEDTALELCGVATYSGNTTGFLFANCSAAGKQAATNMWVNVPNNSWMIWQGYTLTGQTDSNPTFPAGADLCLYALWPNDASVQYGIWTPAEVAKLTWNAMRRANPATSIILDHESDPSILSSDWSSGWQPNSVFNPEYRAAMEWARHEWADIGAFDWAGVVGLRGNTLGYQLNNVHLLDKGHKEKARRYMQVL